MEAAPPPSAARLWTRNLLLALAANFSLFCGMQILTPTLPLYIVGLGGSEPDVGLAMGAFVFTAVVVRLLGASAADEWGLKRVLLGSVAVFTTCGLLYPLMPSVGAIIVLRALHGAGWALAAPVASTVIAEEAPARRRGQALGVLGLTTNVSSATAPLLAFLLADTFGYAVMFVGAALISGLSLLAGSFLRLPAARTAPQRKGPRRLLPAYAALPALVLGLSTMTWGALTAFIPLHIVAARLGSPALFYTTVALVGIVTRPLVGSLVDRLGRSRVLLPALAAMGLSLAGITVASSPLGLAAASACFGLSWSAASTTLMVIFIDRSPPGERGAATAAYFFGFEVGLSIGPVLAGPLATWLGIAEMLRLYALAPLAAMVVAWLTKVGGARPEPARGGTA